MLARGAERIGSFDVGGAPHLAEYLDETILRNDAGASAGENCQRLRTPGIAHRPHAFGDLVQRLVPRNRFEAPVAARADALQWASQPALVVVELQGQLGLRADLAFQHGVLFVARDLNQLVVGEVKLGGTAIETDVAATRLDSVRLALLARLAIGIDRFQAVDPGRQGGRVHHGRSHAAPYGVRLSGAVDPVEINGCRPHQEMIVVTGLSALQLGAGQMVATFPKTDGVARTDTRTRRAFPDGTPIGAQVTFHRMMVDGIKAHRAVRTGDHAFATARASILDDADHSGLRIFDDCLGIDRACAQARRTLALLARDRKEIERRIVRVAQPYDLVAIFARPEPMLLLAGDLAALAADAALQVDHQREPTHVTTPRDATT